MTLKIEVILSLLHDTRMQTMRMSHGQNVIAATELTQKRECQARKTVAAICTRFMTPQDVSNVSLSKPLKKG